EQAMPGGGELTIQAAKPQAALLAIELSLIDTGKGMSAEVLAKIFRPFYSTKQGGSGLGLATVKKIVEGHGGTIEVQSEIERGTKFTIRLPADGDRPSAPGLPK